VLVTSIDIKETVKAIYVVHKTEHF